ncbi:MAG: hypothetical protein UHS51_02315, partial [Atopobiaceae bacterium]|nr:hypothetical protein [Atopobiaceae bacterium]
MRKKLFALLAAMVLAITLLPACGAQQSAGGGATDDVADQVAFTESELEVISSGEDAPKTLTVRFYEETPSVPYIGLAQYMN